ncbi:MAG: hypothetical protein Q4P28_04545 [Tissierellia bacterium]|nr:hypothetical protein [Tissierellia bacterium]
MKNVNRLRVFAKISLVFAVIITLGKLFLQPEYQMMIRGDNLEPSYIMAMVINLVFNLFLFIGGAAIFSALADLLEKAQR